MVFSSKREKAKREKAKRRKGEKAKRRKGEKVTRKMQGRMAGASQTAMMVYDKGRLRGVLSLVSLPHV